MEPQLTSTQNDRVKAVAALLRKKERDATGRYVVEGPNAVGEALIDGVVDEVFATVDVADLYDDGTVRVTTVADHVLERMSDARTPQGVVAVARKVEASLDQILGRGFIVVLHEVSDPGNAGTIIRTADAAGATGVVLTTGSVDPWNPKAVRSTAGSLTHLPIVTGVSTEAVTDACRAVGQRVVGLDAGGHVDVDDPDATAPPVALVFGAEAHGLPDAILDRLDLVVSVPRYGRAESLNLAAAVAVTTFAVARRVHGDRSDV